LVGLLERGISQPQGLYLHTGHHKENKRTQTSISPVRVEPTIQVFEQAKTVHALYHTANVIVSHYSADKLNVIMFGSQIVYKINLLN
jgi:hypothetical protein